MSENEFKELIEVFRLLKQWRDELEIREAAADERRKLIS